RIKEAVAGVIDDLADHADASPVEAEATVKEASPAAAPDALAADWQGQPVLVIAGRGSLDEAAAAMLAQLLERERIGARLVARPAPISSSPRCARRSPPLRRLHAVPVAPLPPARHPLHRRSLRRNDSRAEHLIPQSRFC